MAASGRLPSFVLPSPEAIDRPLVGDTGRSSMAKWPAAAGHFGSLVPKFGILRERLSWAGRASRRIQRGNRSQPRPAAANTMMDGDSVEEGQSEIDFDAQLQRVIGRVPIEPFEQPQAERQRCAFVFLFLLGAGQDGRF